MVEGEAPEREASQRAVLETAWQPARRAGVLGSDTIEELHTHAVGYLPAACGRFDTFTAVDLGSGAGVPGLLLALWCPQSQWSLVDSSERRCEMARAAVRALELDDRVSVTHRHAEQLGHDDDWRHRFDLVVARSFGPPAELAELGLPLTNDAGELVVSVTATTSAVWQSPAAAEAGINIAGEWSTPAGAYLSARRGLRFGTALPRRSARRSRDPLLP